MRIATSYLITTFALLQTLNPVYGQSFSNTATVYETPEPAPQAQLQKPQKPFTAFTGKTLKNKVRVRLQATLDAPILREINKGDVFVVVGETEDFYAIEAPLDIKGYVFRTYVLDNTIEGSKVNVRLEPTLDAPIIAQLHTGDQVDGKIADSNNKWLEINPPSSTRFYVSKDFIENIGDVGLKSRLDNKNNEGTRIYNIAVAQSQAELNKPWNEIHLDSIKNNLNSIVNNYSEFPDLQNKAKDSLASIQDIYLKKKMEYLEGLAQNVDYINAQNKELNAKIAAQQTEKNLTQNESSEASYHAAPNINGISPVDRMNSWLPVENRRYETWSEMHYNQPISTYYDEQIQSANTLKGIIQVYDRAVRNRPGDYILVNSTTKVPMAYLYSTRINLQDYVGREVSMKASSRDNNNFAYPAYFVLSVE